MVKGEPKFTLRFGNMNLPVTALVINNLDYLEYHFVRKMMWKSI